MSEEDQEVIEGQDGESTEETVQEVAQEVVKPPRGLVYVDLNEDQARIMPGRPKENMMEDEKDDGGKIKFDDENIVGDTTMARRRNFVKHILNVNNDEVRGDIYVDYMANAVLFCQENKFSDEQTSAFFAIAKRTFHASKGDETTQLTGSSFLKRDDAYTAFRNLLLQHCVEKPPESVKIFTKDEVKKVTIFMTSTYFRQYEAYEIAFTQEQELRRLPLDVVVETPLRPTPLTAAQEVPRPVPKKIVEEQPEEIENSNNIDNNDENKMDEGGKTEETEEIIEVPEHLQEIVNKKVQEEQERLQKEIEDMTNTLDKKRLLLVNDDEEIQGENDNNVEVTEHDAETVVE
eukprot:g4701.t1